jgi:hypothetical protein
LWVPFYPNPYSCSFYLAAHLGVLPTPSPELNHTPAHVQTSYHPSHNDIYLQNQRHHVSSWDVLPHEGTAPSVPTGSKRSHDYSFDLMVTDMKKRRIAPSYDSGEYAAL